MNRVDDTFDTSKVTPHESKHLENLVSKCRKCQPASIEAVHDLLDQVRGMVAKSWLEDRSTLRWFIEAGGPEALARHGWTFTWHPGGGCLVERAVHPGEPGSGAAERFLLALEVTGDRDDWMPRWLLRGMWHAEHVKLRVADRDDGITLLLSMDGVCRGRIKDVGGVVRGVRLWEPDEAERLVVEAFGARVVSRG
jgi:hypothetical protein